MLLDEESGVWVGVTQGGIVVDPVAVDALVSVELNSLPSVWLFKKNYSHRPLFMHAMPPGIK